MKKRFISIAFILLIGVSGCSQRELPAETVPATQTRIAVSETEPQTQAVTTGFVVPKDLPEVDVDLSAMSKTMMYSQVYDMIYNPDQYLGKTVRILGPFDQYTDEETGETHCACLIEDAAACCTQGIEFEPADADMAIPLKGSMVLVSGTFDTYMNGPFLYCVLREAVLENSTREIL